LLVVIGIMALLIALLMAAVGPAITSAREKATMATLKQIDAAIQQRINTLNRLDLGSERQRLASIINWSSSHTTQQKLVAAEFLLRKNLYRQALPQRIEDLWGFDFDGTTSADNSPIYKEWLASSSSAPPGAPSDNDATHSSEVLLYALTNGARVQSTLGGAVFLLPTLDIGTINPRHVSDTDGDGLLEFVDAWGQPLQFYNFPTRLIRPGGVVQTSPLMVADITYSQYQVASLLIRGIPAVPTIGLDGDNYKHILNRDTSDPLGTVTGNFYNESFTINVGSGIAAMPFSEAGYFTPATYSVPLLVSAGPDEILGLGSPTAGGFTSVTADKNRLAYPVNADAMTDNLTNRQQ
jgi:type II secretory pathway pseudopilin PulG